MLAEAVQADVAEWIDARRGVVDERGRQQVVCNGYLPKRSTHRPAWAEPICGCR
jgi:hypothetical protein